MKTCTKCKEVKSYDFFSKNKNRKDGYQTNCKTCVKEYFEKNKENIIQYYQKNKEKLKEYNKNYKLQNKEKIKQYSKEYDLKHKERRKEIVKEYRLKNKEKINQYKKEYYEKNKEKINEYEKRKEYFKEYTLKNKEKRYEYNKQYRIENKEKIKEYCLKNKEKMNEYKKNYQKNRAKKDNLYKFTIRLRTLILHTFKRNKKNNWIKKTKTENILGCTISEFRSYIEKQFKKDMTFENHGEWHLDHIIPISSAKSEEDIIKLNHYTNFQPLWAKDNLIKSNKIINNIQLKLI